MSVSSLMVLLLAAAAATMPTIPLEDDLGPETLATSIDDAQRMTVETQVNGHGPYRFTIDTGADRSVISSRLASELRLPAGRDVNVLGISGSRRVATVQLDRLRVGARERRRLSAPVLEEAALGSRGFLGIDALKDQRILLDFKRNRITLATSPREAMDGDPDVIVVTGRSRFGQLILTDAQIGKVKVYAIIDTGAQNTIGNLALRRTLMKGAPSGRVGVLVGVTGIEMPAELSVVPRIRLGGLTLGNMPIAYADVQTFRLFGVGERPAILVGMDVLRGFERVAVDFPKRQVRFRVGEGPLGQPMEPASPLTL